MQPIFSKIIKYSCALIHIVFWSQLAAKESNWIALFNGKDLTNWTPKFAGKPLGENYLNTFQVKDGKLIVSYENWSHFNNEFGHLFYAVPYSNYVLRATYRFVGEQVRNGPDWAYRNNGFMLHSQPPESMTLEQGFPTSIEVQLLGGNGKDKRATGNLCTPETSIVMGGKRVHEHCIDSKSKTYHGDQWVNVEIEVRGSAYVKHKINGVVVMEYSGLQKDNGTVLSHGYIAIQAESHGTEFKRIELLPLNTKYLENE
ncbi:MAG: DUF1080 domain-containing protein [Aliiglaciecola sp.]